MGADFALTFDRLHFIAEAYYRDVIVWGVTPNFSQWGATAQVGYFIPDIKLEVAVRSTYANMARSIAHDDMTTFDTELNYYIVGNHAKLQLRYEYAHGGANFSSNVSGPASGANPAPTAPAWTGSNVVGTYMPGGQHRLMLQAQLFF